MTKWKVQNKEKSMKKKSHKFTEGEMESIAKLGEVLRGIHSRLIMEGVIKVKNGKVIWPKVEPE